MKKVPLTGRERVLPPEKLIVSKTTPKGVITYCNDVLLDIAGYSESEMMGKPHNMVRHPDMPKCAFKVWWDHLNTGKEVFAYVVNTAKNGDHYWVQAHGTASYDSNGTIVGLHSNRRAPNREVLDNVITPLYRDLRNIENSHPGPKGMEKSYERFIEILKDKGMEYNEWFFSVS